MKLSVKFCHIWRQFQLSI